MTSSTDYYEILGVDRGASPADIKRAFRSKAREVHPDTCDHPDAEDDFKRLNEAYETLSDPEKRAMYDQFGTADPRRAGNGYGYGGMEDFGVGFGDLFSVFFEGVGAGAGRSMRREGRHMAAQVIVDLREAADGADREVTYSREAPCDTCGGSGAAEGGEVKTCPDCSGTGQQRAQRRTFLGTFQSTQPCARCGTLGTIVEPACATCGGSGRAPRQESVTVHVRAGAHDGEGLEPVAGMGEAGIRGATPGDLHVTVRVRPHEYLHREGDDLHCRADVPMVRAALGGELSIEGLRGPVTVHVPAGTQNGDTLVARGEGMPRGRGGEGDLVVHANVVVPRKLSKRQRELLDELSGELGDRQESSTLHRIRDWLGV